MTGETPQEATPHSEAIRTASDLTGALLGVRTELSRLGSYGKRNRLLVVFDIAATVIAIVATSIALHANSNATHAQANAAHAYSRFVAVRASQISACQVGNDLRSGQRALWEHLVAVSKPPAHQTKAQAVAYKRKIDALLAYVRKTFPQLNCKQLYHIK